MYSIQVVWINVTSPTCSYYSSKQRRMIKKPLKRCNGKGAGLCRQTLGGITDSSNDSSSLLMALLLVLSANYTGMQCSVTCGSGAIIGDDGSNNSTSSVLDQSSWEDKTKNNSTEVCDPGEKTGELL